MGPGTRSILDITHRHNVETGRIALIDHIDRNKDGDRYNHVQRKNDDAHPQEFQNHEPIQAHDADQLHVWYPQHCNDPQKEPLW